MKKNSLTLSLPEWIDDFLKEYQFPLVSNEERMRFVLKLTLQNIEKTTGGPFGAAVFERESGQLVSVGVNVVLKQGCSAAHAEMMAIMLAQQELGRKQQAIESFSGVVSHGKKSDKRTGKRKEGMLAGLKTFKN